MPQHLFPRLSQVCLIMISLGRSTVCLDHTLYPICNAIPAKLAIRFHKFLEMNAKETYLTNKKLLSSEYFALNLYPSSLKFFKSTGFLILF